MADPNACILIIDDEEDMCNMISIILNNEGYKTYTAHDGQAGVEVFRKKFPDAVILDLNMPKMNGMEVLKEIKKIDKNIPVIIITAYGEVRSAVEAIKLGAYNYFNKPFNNDEVLLTVKNALKEMAMHQELHQLKTQFNLAMPLFDQMGHSDTVTKVNEQVECVAPTNLTVVIQGETGVGKELIARSIHDRSPRRKSAFIPIDCGAIPEGLIESELFGHEKGAFTNAVQMKKGQFETASGGTLFLDEIGNLPHSMQSKLLRVLQERKIRRLGDDKEVELDVRIIAAGNEGLEFLVESGRFRMDLYQRLSEFCIEIPPLRQRKDDIVFLSKRFLDISNKELNKSVRGISEAALDLLLSYNWPGNVRELKNVIRRSVLIAKDTIKLKHILINAPVMDRRKERSRNDEKQMRTAREDHETGYADYSDIGGNNDLSLHDAVAKETEKIEKKMISEALKQMGGNKAKASKLLKIDYKTLYYKVKKYGITVKTRTEINN